MPLERADLIDPTSGSPEEPGQNKPVLLRASRPESHTVYEVVARMELVGGVFSRTMVGPVTMCSPLTTALGSRFVGYAALLLWTCHRQCLVRDIISS